MKSVVVALVFSTVAAQHAGGSELAPQPLQLRPKAALAAAEPPKNSAPFAVPMLVGPDLDLLPRRDERQEESRSSCSGERSLCYDAASGRIVYKPARAFMPDLPGLQRENISIKRDRIVLRYSF